MAAEALKDKLIEQLDKLPEDRVREVLDFVGHLLARERRVEPSGAPNQLDPKVDPLLEFIGMADVEPFAQEIDRDLYGN
ncbi:MAG: hypothetical protein R6U88_04520 [Candidatus Bipolaricaulota bacterium]